MYNYTEESTHAKDSKYNSIDNKVFAEVQAT